jgi:hypothetical protein
VQERHQRPERGKCRRQQGDRATNAIEADHSDAFEVAVARVPDEITTA